MKIYDCFMFFDEEMLLDLRLNIMNQYIDKFIITEATYTHSGKPKKLIFDINKFSKFRDKIIYIIVDKPPPNLFVVNSNDDVDTMGNKLILNGYKRDNFQRQKAQEALTNLDPDDWVFINDIDEIPNLKNIDLRTVNKKILIFKQKMFYYKFNLLSPTAPWFGSRACKKKNLISPQWLRDLKHRKYSPWRLDILFSKKKYNSISYVNDGGWHFTNIKSPEEIEKKLLSYTHHHEFEESKIDLSQLKEKIDNKKAIYDLSVDSKKYKWNSEKVLKRIEISEMPDYLRNNLSKYSEWIDS